jgi:murein L,D-transpeptidase YcbB/YkuD
MDERKIRLNGGKEKWYTLQNKIPVYIGYFTACLWEMKFILMKISIRETMS